MNSTSRAARSGDLAIWSRVAQHQMNTGRGRPIMEHRCTERIATALPAVVHTVRDEVIRGTIRNLSASGAFLALPADCSILPGFVEIEVHLPYEEPLPCRWRAYVVHREAGGVGVLLDERHLGDLLPFLCAESSARRSQGQEIRSPSVVAATRVASR